VPWWIAVASVVRGVFVSAAVLLVSRRPALLEPLADTCALAGLDVDVADDAAAAAANARARASRDDAFVGVVVDVDAVGDFASSLCEELRLVPGLHDAPIVLLGSPEGPLSSTNAAVAAGGDAFFALPVEARWVVAKLLIYGGAPTTTLAPTSPVLPLPSRTTSARVPAFAAAATPDELLASLEDTAISEAVDGARGEDSRLAARAGRVGPGDVAALLWAAHVGGHTGTFEFLDDVGVQRTCRLVRGATGAFRSGAPGEQPAAIVVRLGWTSAGRIAALRLPRGLPEDAFACCRILADAGAILPEERAPLAQAIVAEQLAAWVTIDSGTWQMRDEQDDSNEQRAPGLVDDEALPTLLAEALRRRFDHARLAAAVGGASTILAPCLTVSAHDDDQRGVRWRRALHADEARALSSFDGERNVDAVIDVAGVAAPVALRAALLGRVFGALEVVERGSTPSAEELASHRTAARTLERERVLERLARARGGDWFQLLSLTSDATAYDVTAAATALRARFDPARALARGVGDLRGALREIATAIDEAEALLVDDDVRETHRRRARS
jgi:hypothetical protein